MESVTTDKNSLNQTARQYTQVSDPQKIFYTNSPETGTKTPFVGTNPKSFWD
jgi:hypothetical protein